MESDSIDPTPPSGPQPVQILITLDPITGNVRVEGNGIANKMLAYGILGQAHDAIYDFHQKATESRIITAFPGPMRVPRPQ